MRASLGEMRPDAIDHQTVDEPPARPLPPKVRRPTNPPLWHIRPMPKRSPVNGSGAHDSSNAIAKKLAEVLM